TAAVHTSRALRIHVHVARGTSPDRLVVEPPLCRTVVPRSVARRSELPARFAEPGLVMRRAVVVGSGPNGLTAAILLARADYDVTVLEAQAQVGGGCRSAALTLPGFIHDVCSAVHPLGVCSPVFASFPLDRHGLEWI